MCTPRRSIRKAFFAVLGLALFASAGAAYAQDAGPQDDPPTRVARLSYLRGDVSFQPAGDDDWVQATLNRPLGTGDKLFTDHDSRVEMEVGAATLRLDAQSSFDIINLNDNVAQTELTQGVMNLHVRRVFEGQTYEVDTPQFAFVISQPGDYRVDIAPDGTSSMVTVFSGNGDVYGENNASYSVRSGQSYRFHDSALRDYEVVDLPRPDDFDNWVQSRNDRYEHAASRQYVSEDVIGYADLDDYGGWSDVPEYGHVWYPTQVSAGWAPYRDGHWAWIDPWGWTWVDDAAWGFAPFHYGRWVYASDRWGWCPGPVAVRPVYAPALVAFVGGAGFGVGVGIATGPVGWFPLGPRDVYVPWYHASHNYFTNVNVRNTTIINNTYITNVYNDYSRGRPLTNVNYAYRTNTAAVTAVSREAFVGARAVNAARVQVNENQLRNASVVSRVGIAPERASFVSANAARARVVPNAQALNRNVIARTPPPPRPVPVATRIDAIKKNNDQPLATQQMRRMAAPATVAAGTAAGAAAMNRGGKGEAQRVTLVGQNGPKPKPIPLRSVGGGNAQTGAVQQHAPPKGPATSTGAATNNARTTMTPTGTPKGNPNVDRGTTNATTGNGLPSSRFAPHPGQPRTVEETKRTTGNPNLRTTTTGGANANANAGGNANGKTTGNNTRTTTTGRTSTATTNATNNNERRTTTTTTHKVPTEDNVHARTPATQYSPQSHAVQNNASKSRNVQDYDKPQSHVQEYKQPQNQTQREYTPRTSPTYERSGPQTQTQVHNPPQVQHNPPPQPVHNAPVQHQAQERRTPPTDKNKDKDKDDNGGHR